MHTVQYPEPEDIIGQDKLKTYFQWWLTNQKYSEGSLYTTKGERQENNDECREIQRRLQNFGYYLSRIWWEYGQEGKRAKPYWNVCAWNDQGLLRPHLLPPDKDGKEDYHKTNWRLWAAPQLLFHARPQLPQEETEELLNLNNRRPSMEDVKRLTRLIIKPIGETNGIF